MFHINLIWAPEILWVLIILVKTYCGAENVTCSLKHHHLGFPVPVSPVRLFMIYKQGMSISAPLGGQFIQCSFSTPNTHGQHLFHHTVQQSQIVSPETAGQLE